MIYSSRLEKALANNKKIVDINDFKFIKQIGKGAFGKVYLVQRKSTGDYYAMKIVILSKNINDKELQNLMNEIDVFQVISGDHDDSFI